jgi:DNA-binding transcriptional regulator YiaG
MPNLPLPTMKKNEPIVSKRLTSERMSSVDLQKFMQKHGIAPKELGEILGVTPQAVALWISGEREFSVTNSRLIRIMDKYPKLIEEF